MCPVSQLLGRVTQEFDTSLGNIARTLSQNKKKKKKKKGGGGHGSSTSHRLSLQNKMKYMCEAILLGRFQAPLTVTLVEQG
jgi:hypothetical protein